jgi:DNA-binding IclR family transcriptional regulator
VSSSGLVLLAHASVDMQERIVAGPLARLTDQTITDGRVLRAKLAEIRRTGYAVCPGYIHPDATGIAVPLKDAGDNVVAALSVITPRDDSAITHLSAMVAAARGIRRTLDTMGAAAERRP